MRKRTHHKRTHRRSHKTAKKKLAGYTKTGGKYALVFKKGTKKYLGKSRYKSKAGLVTAARKYLKK